MCALSKNENAHDLNSVFKKHLNKQYGKHPFLNLVSLLMVNKNIYIKYIKSCNELK